MLKVPLFDCAINENCFFFVPTTGHLVLKCPSPREFAHPSKVKIMLMPGGEGCISWKHSVPRELVVPIFSKISRGSTVYAGFFSSITSGEFKRNFTLKRSPVNCELIKRITKLLNFPPVWEKVFLTLAVPLSCQKQF